MAGSYMNLTRRAALLLLLLIAFIPLRAEAETIEADLLVVGGTESGCAAAVQAARMGVERVVLVNDIEWLGGQFSAEALGAIDENRGHGYDGTVPIPRSGIFRDVIDAIEAKNAERYGGVRRPGNTRVITTSRPVVSQQVFRELLATYEKTGQIQRFSNYQVSSVLTEDNCVQGVKFNSTADNSSLIVRAAITIDASDWGDVIRLSGAGWDVGLDARHEYDEPSAPESGEPRTDINPITWCMILEEQANESRIAKPAGYDPRYFTGKWGWIDEKFAYTSRRLVDSKGFAQIKGPDLLLVNTPPIDYPLDVFPADVAAALEETEQGASQKSIVEMTHQQRAIVYADAKNHSLKFLYYLQDRFPKFRKMALSDEFGTTDNLPPKPYIRESLRLDALHVLREQEVLGFQNRSHYATAMFPDAVFSWQFELDFHPTHRSWRTDQLDAGPWEADFRGNRRFGRGGTGRAVFPLRSFVPKGIDGLLGGQKNLGYTSIVSSSCRLHDQSIHAGQASGAIAAVCLRHEEQPSTIWDQRERLAEIWNGLLATDQGAPLAIWPFADVDPLEPGFAAIQQLALRRLLPLGPASTSFDADAPATSEWTEQILLNAKEQGYDVTLLASDRLNGSRRDVAVAIWKVLQQQPTHPWRRQSKQDADLDGLVDADDALPFTTGTVSWKSDPRFDGLVDESILQLPDSQAFDFTGKSSSPHAGYLPDIGEKFEAARGYGWQANLTKNTRQREDQKPSPRSTFVFTRSIDTWELALPNGRYRVIGCLGDVGHEQAGQNLSVEGDIVADHIDTDAGSFYEFETTVDVNDGRLTLVLGKPMSTTNTCLNWLVIIPADESTPGSR
ncbi:FAD-dependent oxidoreductase [Bremerella cremea]|uniref:FAD-dependent oxidoreductase n=1 Tax=Bremerella cremea TaxID=1031537 RepID=UPI0031E68400